MYVIVIDHLKSGLLFWFDILGLLRQNAGPICRCQPASRFFIFFYGHPPSDGGMYLVLLGVFGLV
jgi:hypothetical protein